MRMLAGSRFSREIYAETEAELVASTPWTQYLADEIRGNNEERMDEEAGNGKRCVIASEQLQKPG